jgi:hypothetical protein
VRVAGERSDVRVTLNAISVLDGLAKTVPSGRLETFARRHHRRGEEDEAHKTAPATDAKKTTTSAAKPAPKDPFAAESKAAAKSAATAMEATRYASTYPTLPTWSKAPTHGPPRRVR